MTVTTFSYLLIHLLTLPTLFVFVYLCMFVYVYIIYRTSFNQFYIHMHLSAYPELNLSTPSSPHRRNDGLSQYFNKLQQTFGLTIDSHY